MLGHIVPRYLPRQIVRVQGAMESEDLTLSSHITLERKCQCQARQEDFLTDGKVKVREDPDRPGDSFVSGEGNVMEPDWAQFCPLTASDSFPSPVRKTPTKHTSLLRPSGNWCSCKLHTAWVPCSKLPKLLTAPSPSAELRGSGSQKKMFNHGKVVAETVTASCLGA